MAGHTYVTKAYSNRNGFPAQEGGYAYGSDQHVNWYVVETRVERVRVPASGYTKYAPMSRYEGYEQSYRPNYENSSSSRYHEEENLMPSFLNNLQIGAGPTMKTSNLSSQNNYGHTSPGKYLSKSPNKYRPTSPNKYRPTSPDKYYHSTSPIKQHPNSPNKYESTSPNKYRSTSPNKNHPKYPNKYKSTSPNKYRPTSPSKNHPKSLNKYESTSPNKYHPTSPNKNRSKSPNKLKPTSLNKYRPSSPEKYQPTSPNKYRPSSPDKYQPTSLNKYRPSSPDKYQPTSPIKYQPTNSIYAYPSKEANMTKAQPLPGPNKYRPTSPTKYLPASPTHNYPSKEDHITKSQNMPGLNKYRPTSPVRSFPSKERQPVRTQSFSGPNKNHSSSLGAEGGRTDFSSPNNHWQSACPPTTRHPLMTPTNNIDEALGFLMESYSPRSHPTREGSFDSLSPRAQPTEHERRYAGPVSGSVNNRPYFRSNTIDSHEAVRRYNGAYVP